MTGLLLNPDPPLTNDGPYYLVLAQSVVSHQGYRDIFHPTEMLDVEYPPLYPLLLAFLLIIFPKTIIGLKLLSILFGVGVLIIVYYFFANQYEDLPELKFFSVKCKTKIYNFPFITYSLLLLLLTFTNLWFLAFSTTIAPEIIYLFFSLITLIFLEKWIDKKNYFNRYLVFTVLSAAMSFYIKALGISLILAGVIYFIIKKYYKKGFLFLIITSSVVLPWIIRNRIINKISLSQDYIGQFFIGNNLNFLDMAETIFYNIVHYIYGLFTLLLPGYFLGKSTFPGEESFSFLYSLIGKKEYFDPQSLNTFTIIVSFLLGLIVAIGFINQLRRKKLPEIYVLSYLFILLLFPKRFYISSSNRYLLPLLPFILCYFLKGIFLFEVWRLKIKPSFCRSLNANFGWILCFILLVGNLVPAGCMIKGNVTYLNSYRFLSAQERKDYHSRWLLDYFSPADWIKENTPQNSVVMHCFPPAFYLQSKRKSVFFLLSPAGPWLIKINLDKMKVIADRIDSENVNYLVVGHQAEREIINYLRQYSKIFMFEKLAIFKAEMKTVEIYKVIKTNSQIKLLNRQGMDYYEKGDYEQAVLKFDRIIQLQPNCKTYFNLGQCYEGQKLFKKAGEMYKEAVRLEVAHKIAKMRMEIVRQKGKIKQNPGDPAGYERIGRFYLEAGNVNKAIENLKYALGLNASGASLHYNLGMAYFAGKKYEEALREFKVSLMLEQDLRNIHIIKHYIKIVKIKL